MFSWLCFVAFAFSDAFYKPLFYFLHVRVCFIWPTGTIRQFFFFFIMCRITRPITRTTAKKKTQTILLWAGSPYYISQTQPVKPNRQGFPHSGGFAFYIRFSYSSIFYPIVIPPKKRNLKKKSDDKCTVPAQLCPSSGQIQHRMCYKAKHLHLLFRSGIFTVHILMDWIDEECSVKRKNEYATVMLDVRVW